MKNSCIFGENSKNKNMKEEKLKELDDLVDDALNKGTKESLNEWMYQNQKQELRNRKDREG